MAKKRVIPWQEMQADLRRAMLSDNGIYDVLFGKYYVRDVYDDEGKHIGYSLNGRVFDFHGGYWGYGELGRQKMMYGSAIN